MIDEEIASGLHPSATRKLARAPLIQILKDLESIYGSRMLFGENNPKLHLLLCAAVAQVEAMENEMDVEKNIMDAIRRSARNSLELLKQRTQIVDTASDTGSGERIEVTEANPGWSGDGDFDFMNIEQDIGNDFLMEDGGQSFDFDTTTSWLFPAWETNTSSL